MCFGSPSAQQKALAAKQLDMLNHPPPPAPDITDYYVRLARKNQLKLAGLGRGRQSTFLTGPAGSPPPSTLLGGGG